MAKKVESLTENWDYVKRLLPEGWEEQARELRAWRRRPRKLESTEALLRVMLIHLGSGSSLRETVVRARAGEIASISDVALLKRLRASGDWLRWMCLKMLEHRGAWKEKPEWLKDYQVRTVDASVVKEPGSRGKEWRVHYSLNLFELRCDEFHVTKTEVGESFRRFRVSPGDLLMGDRAYGNLKGLRHVVEGGGHFIVRLKNRPFELVDSHGEKQSLSSLTKTLGVGEIGDWQLRARVRGEADMPLRLCAVRISDEAAGKTIRRAAAKQRKKQRSINPETLALHSYVIIATSLPETVSSRQIMELYKARWQIELHFKRLKSILGLGHLPKRDEKSAKAWLHGKLLVAFLTQALLDEGRLFSPWGYPLL